MTLRRRLLRIAAWLAAGVLALVLLVAGTLAFLVTTQSGTRFLFGRLGALMPGSFEVRQVTGRIDSPLTLEGVVYKRPTMEVRIDRLYLEWDLKALLHRRVDVRRLYADGIHVESKPAPSQEPTTLPDLDLHFNIIVRDARVRGLTLGSGGTAPPQTIDEIDLDTKDIQNRVHVERLAVRSKLLDADVTGDVEPRGDYPVDLNVRYTLRPAAQAAAPSPAAPPAAAAAAAQPAAAPLPDIVGGGRLTGTLAALHVDQALTAPFNLRLAALLTQPLRNLSFDGQVTFTGVDPHRLRPDLPELPAAGTIAARGTLDRFETWGTLDGAVDPAGPFHLAFRVARQTDTWQVRQADITLAGLPTRLGLIGKVALPPNPTASVVDADLQATWKDLAWPPRGKASFASPSGQAHVVAHLSTPTPPPAAGSAGTVAAAPAPAAAVLTSQGSVRAVVATIGALAVDYQVSRQGAAWHVAKAEVALPGTPAHLAATGQLTPRGNTFDIAADLNWRDLAWPLTGPAQVKSAQGDARLTGTLDDFKLQMNAALAAGAAAAASLGLPAAGAAVSANAGPAGASSTPATAAAAAAPAPAHAAGVNQSTAPAGPLPAGRLALAAHGSRNQLHIESLAADLQQGHVQAHGDVAWSPRLTWNLALAAQQLDPAIVRPDFPGRLDFTVATHGASEPAGLQGAVDLPRLTGTLRGQPVTLAAAVGLAGAMYNVSNLDATWGTTHLKASGRIGDRLDLTFDAATANLGLLLPDAAGSLAAQGHASGPLKTPRIQANVKTQGLHYGAQSVGAATLRADVDLAPAGSFQVDLDAHLLNGGGQLVDHAVLAGRGTTASHTLTLSVTGLGDSKDAHADLGLAGGVSGPLGADSIWRGQITRLDLRSSPVGNWGLQQSAALTAGAREIDLRDLCWAATGGPPVPAATGAGSKPAAAAKTAPSTAAGASAAAAAPTTAAAKLCASAAWSQAGPWAGEVTLAALPLNLLQPFLPPDLTLTGEINGTAKAHGGAKGIAAADIDIAPGPGELRFPTEGGRTASVHFDRGTLRAQAGPAGGTASATLSLTNVGTFDAKFDLPRLTQGLVLRDQPLRGTLQANVKDIAFAEAFDPDIHKLTGSLTADLRLAGTVGKPSVAGEARLAGASAEIPLLGLHLKDVQLTAAGNGSGALQIQGGARSDSGALELSGSAGLMPSAATPVHLTLNGSRFAVMNTKDIRILVTPKIDLAYDGASARVTGDVTIPEAHIHVEKAAKAGPVQPSKDVVYVGAVRPQTDPAQAKAVPLALHARVRLIIPNPAIELDAFGLKGIPYGTLLIVESPGHPTSGTGELDIAKGGTFNAYGQNLTIERGRLVFGGPVGNPGLDIRASRLSDDQTVTAGIDAKGTLDKPEISVWSTPTMGDSDALAYLVLGHGLNSASQQEGNRVANAAQSLGVAGASMIAKNIGSRFGLEEASITSSGGLDQASLVLGKYLAPHLYVLYGIGLFQPVSTFRVRYIISSKWTLQAESSTETGADILYTLERGHTRR